MSVELYLQEVSMLSVLALHQHLKELAAELLLLLGPSLINSLQLLGMSCRICGMICITGCAQ